MPTSCHPHTSESWRCLFPPRPPSSSNASHPCTHILTSTAPVIHRKRPASEKKGPAVRWGQEQQQAWAGPPLCFLASAQPTLAQSSEP